MATIQNKSPNNGLFTFSTAVLDGELRDIVICNLCSTAMEWKSENGSVEKLQHRCEINTSISKNESSEVFLKASPRSSFEKEDREEYRSQFSKSEIVDLLEKSSPRVRLLPKKGKSNVWKYFSVIEVDGIPQHFAYCKHCHSIVTWKSKDGTNSLRKHSSSWHNIQTDLPVSELFAEGSMVNSSVTEDLPDEKVIESNRISKREMQNLINTNSPRISLVPGKGRSQVWMAYSLVKVDGQLQDFAICKECNSAIIWKSKDGTTGLRKHICKTQRMTKRIRLSALETETPHTSALTNEYPKEEPLEDSGIVLKLSKEEVQKLVDESSDRVSLTPSKGKSDVWMTFSIVEVDGEQMDLALCNQCNIVVTWKSKDGTNGLRKHLCKQERVLQNVSSYKKYPIKTSSPSVELEEAAAMMCSIDVRPVGLISGQGFVNFIHYVYNLGAVHGMCPDVKDFLPNEKAVARRMEEIALVEKENLISELQLCPSFGVTLDLWCHHFTRKYFLGISIHYMLESEESLLIKNRVLCNCEVEDRNGESIREKTMSVLKEFGAYRKNVYVTDDDELIAQALIKEKRLLCAGHGINLCLKSVFDNITYEEFPDVVNLLQASRALVSYVKNSGIQTKLEEDGKALQEENENFWYSSFYMLQSILNATPKLAELLNDVNDLSLLYSIDCNLLEEIVKLLKPFDEATKLLALGKMPTLSLVIPTKVKLKKCLDPKDDDSEVIKQLKWQLKQSLDEKFVIDVVHCVATVLHPKMKSFVKQYLGEETFEATKQQITCILNNINGSNGKKDVPTKIITEIKVERDESEFLSEVMSDCVAEESDEEEDELTFYLNSKYSTRFSDPLIYWKQNASLCPNLFKVAKSILAIPATGISCERYFTDFGRQMEERRNCLSANSLNSILFINSAMKE